VGHTHTGAVYYRHPYLHYQSGTLCTPYSQSK
jgi:hypothetical protein